MAKYLIFSILIFSNIAVASEWKNPQPSSLIDGMIQDYVQHVPANIRQGQALGISYSNSSSPFNSLTLGLSIIQGVVNVVQRINERSSRQLDRTSLQRCSDQQTNSNNQPVNIAVQSAVEAMDAIDQLDEEDLKRLAESEEHKNSSSHYFRDKYAEYQSKHQS